MESDQASKFLLWPKQKQPRLRADSSVWQITSNSNFLFFQHYGKRHCLFRYWDVMGLPEDKKEEWIDLEWVAAIQFGAMRAVQ